MLLWGKAAIASFTAFTSEKKEQSNWQTAGVGWEERSGGKGRMPDNTGEELGGVG